MHGNALFTFAKVFLFEKSPRLVEFRFCTADDTRYALQLMMQQRLGSVDKIRHQHARLF